MITSEIKEFLDQTRKQYINHSIRESKIVQECYQNCLSFIEKVNQYETSLNAIHRFCDDFELSDYNRNFVIKSLRSKLLIFSLPRTSSQKK